ncbi:hypothetical protein [Paraglaciecola sp.]|uniref:hypothetical protein n=1 Tax=Paraglaciecola sp. TaxID=1920173 RepID=UPI0030F3747F
MKTLNISIKLDWVYVIHSSKIPSCAPSQQQIKLASDKISLSKLWVNPYSGLKTRRCEEVLPALQNMQEAVLITRAKAQKSVA